MLESDNGMVCLAPLSIVAPNSDQTTYTYDGFGRVATATSHFGAVTVYSYDPANRQVVETTASMNRWRRTTMDGFGRTIKQEAGSGSTAGSGTMSTVDTQYAPCACSPLGTRYNYQGNMTTVTDPAGKWKAFVRDAFGNLVEVMEPNPDHRGSC